MQCFILTGIIGAEKHTLILSRCITGQVACLKSTCMSRTITFKDFILTAVISAE